MHPVFAWIAAAQGCSPEQAAEAFAGWELVDYHIDGEPVCCALVKGTEVHFAVAPSRRGRLITRHAARRFLAPLFGRMGFLTTRVLTERIDCQQFVRRIGFKPTWSDGNVDYFMLTTLPFEGRHHA